MSEPRIVILGGGPAGVGAAFKLREQRRAEVTLIEQSLVVGGNAGSFEAGGQRLDYGSHRLHPSCEPAILADIGRLLGTDLLDRPRHGRIRLRGRWIHFPLKPADLLLRLDPAFGAGVARDMVLKPFRGATPESATFASVLMANLGPTICNEFYFPYSRKIWGREPIELSATQARRRVSAGSFGKLIRKVLAAVPGLKPPGSGRFFYPQRGFGQISEAYAAEAARLGADLWLGWKVVQLDPPTASRGRWLIGVEREGQRRELEADYVWSTIPLTTLAGAMRAEVPAAVTEAARSIDYRAMILIYLELPVSRFTEFDAHYFPGANIRITRLSEPKNYANLSVPADRTTLCAELPASPSDAWWTATDAEIGRLVSEDLATAGIPLPANPVSVRTRRLRYAYPVYLTGYEGPFGVLDQWAESLPRFLSYGRQGLFAHDNTHHALSMAYSAVECLENGTFDADRWRQYRQQFATHVVED